MDEGELFNPRFFRYFCGRFRIQVRSKAYVLAWFE